MDVNFIFVLVIVIMSAVIHEVAHGYAAERLGDPTARLAGRLTLNPLVHLDPFGSVLLPLLLAMLPGDFIFAWAKPVPYNPYNLRWSKYDEAIVAGAGPLSNIIIAFIFGMVLRFGLGVLPTSATEIVILIVFINLVLAFFNLIPVPPLDGSKILFTLLPLRFQDWRYKLERYGLILVFAFVFFLWPMFFPVIKVIFSLITGIPF